MALYKYFSQQLLDKNLLNLDDVFPLQQDEARKRLKVSYGLAEIVNYVKDSTLNFERSEIKFIDLDNAIEAIVRRYYRQAGKTDPFEITMPGIEQVDEGTIPREAVIFDDGKLKGKGTVKPAKRSKSLFKPEEPVTAVAEPAAVEPPVEVEAVFDAEIEKDILKGKIEAVEEYPELAEDKETMQDIQDQIISVFAFDDVAAKEWFDANKIDYKKYNS